MAFVRVWLLRFALKNVICRKYEAVRGRVARFFIVLLQGKRITDMLKKLKDSIAHAPHGLSRLLLLMGLLLVLACHDDERPVEPEPSQEEETQPEEPRQEVDSSGMLVSVVRTEEINFVDALEGTLTELGVSVTDLPSYSALLEIASLRSRVYNAHVVTYHTTDPYGQPVVASGVVYYPQTGKPKGVIEALSFHKEKYTCPSKQIGNSDMLPGLSGYIVLVADLIGSGSTESMVPPYLYFDNAAKVSADLRRAATELVSNVYAVDMPKKTIITGYSLGASEAWALARYYHFHPELDVQPKEVWIGGGVYNPLGVLRSQLQTGYTDYVFIPNAMYSLNYYEKLGLDLHDVFRGKLSEHYEEWCTGNVSVTSLSSRLGTDISQYLNMDFFDESNPVFQDICTRLERFAIPNDWVPSCKIHVYHGRDDTFVPISSSDELVDYLRSVGADVDYVTKKGGHAKCGITMITDLMMKLYY